MSAPNTDDTATCPACEGSGFGVADTMCGYCGGCGGVPIAAAQRLISERRKAEGGAVSNSDFWNGILRDHANANSIAVGVTETVASAKAASEYRGWSISWDYGEYSATSPNYDASWEGPEDGWVDNGERVFAHTLVDLYAEVDAFLAERGQ